MTTNPGTSDADFEAFIRSLPDGGTGRKASFGLGLHSYLTRMTQAQAEELVGSGNPILATLQGKGPLFDNWDGCFDGSEPKKWKEHVFSDAPHGKPNHVLINEYLPGQGIMPHEDGDAYWPVVCTVSLGSSIVYDAHPKEKEGGPRKKWRILQEPRSLLITAGEIYKGCLHGIESVEVDEDVGGGEGGVANWDLLRKETRDQIEKDGARNLRGTRISLTFRDVIKVKKLGKGLGFLAK